MTIFISWTKFTKKEYFWSKIEKVNIIIESTLLQSPVKSQFLNLLCCWARKGRQLRDRTLQRGSTPISSRRKTNQTIKEGFLLKYYASLVIFRRWWSTDVYKESYKQDAINTAFFSASSKTFLKQAHQLVVLFVSHDKRELA